MLSTRNPLLTKFGVAFTIMSYYEQTHQSFLLLSKLTKQSRIMLDENYEAFLNSMIANNASIDEEIVLKCQIFLQIYLDSQFCYEVLDI